MPRLFKDASHVFLDLNGTAPAAGGSVRFYDLGTTTDADTWSDFDLASPAHLNPNPVGLDSAGRLNVPVWLDGDYTVVLKDADGTEIATWDERPQQSSALAIPTPLPSDNFLTNDGSNLLWQAIRQVADPTGSAGRIYTTDGTEGAWSDPATFLASLIPAAPTLDITIGSNYIKIGDGSSTTKVLLQFGSDTGPASGNKSTSKAVTFDTAYDSLWYVGIETTGTSYTPSGALVDTSASGITHLSASTGFTANFNVSDDDSTASWKIQSDVPFVWFAIGTVTE